jgi:predicted type IV restriction endonuclease
MVQIIQPQNVTFEYLEERFGLQQVDNQQFFTEWFENLAEIPDLDKQYLDRVKLQLLRLIKRSPLLENAVKLVILSPLLNLAGFYDEPFFLKTEKSIEIKVEDQDEIIKGRIDVLVVQDQLWLLVIESKKASFSLIEAIPQALSYMIANPNLEKPIFGLVTNGEDFQVIKLIKEDKPKYALSDKFTLFRKENELYQVLAILRKIGQILV